MDWHYIRVIDSGEYVATNYDFTPNIYKSKVFSNKLEAEDYLLNHVSSRFINSFIVVSKEHNHIFDMMHT